MFLNKDNNIKWKCLAVATAITMVIIMSFILWFDIPVFTYLHGFDNIAWDTFSDIFGSKIWIFVTLPIFLIFAILKIRMEPGGTSKRFFARIWNFIKNIKMHFINFIKWLNYNRKDTGYKSFGIVSLIARSAFVILCAIAIESIIVGALKFLLGRFRPIAFEWIGEYGFYPLNAEWVFNSMPSGHTAVSFAGLVTIGMLFPKIKWPAWGLAIMVGVSRIVVGDHFPADVIFGAFIGMVVADIVQLFMCRVKN